MTIELLFLNAYGDGFQAYIKRVGQIAEWVDEQTPRIKWTHFSIDKRDIVWRFTFEKSSQAVLFKLLWGGK